MRKLAFALLLLGSPAAALAESAESTRPAGALEAVIVTAQKQAQNLQDVPLSLQVVDAEVLAQQNLVDVVELARLNPSIRVQSSGRSSYYYIRGTGSGESQSFDQSVGTFIDDIYHGRSRYSDAAFLDLDHVELLKGPQSTFFGNSAIAGAINIVTREPDDEFGGWGRALYTLPGGDSAEAYAAEGALNMPLRDGTALRIAGIVNGERGYLRNIATGDRPGKENYAFRGTLRHDASDRLTLVFKAETGRSRSDAGLVVRQVNCPPPAPFVTAGFCGVNVANGHVTPLRSNDYVTSEGNRSRLDTDAVVLRADYDLGGSTLTSVTGHTHYDYALDFDIDGTALTLMNVHAPEQYEQFSQEFRITTATGGAFEFTGGVYFQKDRLDLEQSVNFFFLTPVIQSIPPFAPLVPYLPFGQMVNARQDEEIYSIFGSATWNVSDRLSVTAGLRGSQVEKDFDWGLVFGTATKDYGGIVAFPDEVVPLANALGLGRQGNVSLNRSDNGWMPSFGIQYRPADAVMTYASYSRGFKSGGFSVAELSADPRNYPFDKEHVDAYEAGLKSELLDRNLVLNLAAFRNDFSDLQVVVQGTNASGALVNLVRNAAEKRSEGVEFEANWIVSPRFRLNVSGMYLDSRYLEYENAGPTNEQQLGGATTQDLSGSKTPYAPEWSGVVAGTVNFPFGRFVLELEAKGIYASEHFVYSNLDPLSYQPSYLRADARITLETADGRWGIDLVGKNLNDELIRTFTGYQPTSLGSLYQDRVQLRTVAVQLRGQF